MPLTVPRPLGHRSAAVGEQETVWPRPVLLEVAGEHHVGAVNHITADELRMRLATSDIYGGLANRYLWARVRRGKLQPDGGNVPESVYLKHSGPIAAAVEHARHNGGEISRTPAARELWRSMYADLDADNPSGMLGHIVARGAPYVLRLAVVFAAFDQADAIDVDHLRAALAIWDCCRASAQHIFADLSADPLANRLLMAIRAAGRDGMDSTAQSAVFDRNVSAKRLDQMRTDLAHLGLIVTKKIPTGGRPRIVSWATEHAPEEA